MSEQSMEFDTALEYRRSNPLFVHSPINTTKYKLISKMAPETHKNSLLTDISEVTQHLKGREACVKVVGDLVPKVNTEPDVKAAEDVLAPSNLAHRVEVAPADLPHEERLARVKKCEEFRYKGQTSVHNIKLN